MKTMNIIKGMALCVPFLFASCSNNEELVSEGNETKVLFTVDEFESATITRTTVDPNNNYAITWASGDAIGIFPREGYQEPFVIPADQVGKSTASFDGGYWALKEGLTYNAYYPFDKANFESAEMKTQIPVTYLGQEQDGTTCGIGAYDYTYSDWMTATSGSVNFKFHHIGAFVIFHLEYPATTTYTKLTLSANADVIPTTGTYDLTANEVNFVADNDALANSISLTLKNCSGTAGETGTFYMMLPPMDLSDNELTVTLTSSAGVSDRFFVESFIVEKGKKYELSCRIESYYQNGIAFVARAGELQSIISEDEMNAITSLKIVGNLNGDDIITLSSMSTIASLDLSNAQIVDGGSAYGYDPDYDDDDERYLLYTKNNIIGARMFRGKKMEEIILPSNITAIEKEAFYNCDKLTSITIPDNVTKIGNESFYDCDELKSVAISGNLNSIGYECFESCEKLESINIPNSVTSIGGDAFYNCSSLKSINIPSSLTVINEYTFGNTSITSVSIPNTVTKIAEAAFSRCKGLKTVTIPNSVTYLSGFGLCDLSEITIPSSVKTIGPHAFDSNKNLNNITIPDDVTGIGYDAFAYCTGLKSVIIPDKVQYVGDQAFSGCSGLTSIILGNSVKTIGRNAFRNCTGVTTLTLPSSIYEIGNYAFAEMQLTEMTCLWTTPPSLNQAFLRGEKIDILYVPKGAKSAYESSDWAQYFENIVEMD